MILRISSWSHIFFHLLISHPYSIALMYYIALQLYPLLNKKDMSAGFCQCLFTYGCLHIKAAAASIPSSERGLSALPLLPFASEG